MTVAFQIEAGMPVHETVIRNDIRCAQCGDEIESAWVNDCKTHKFVVMLALPAGCVRRINTALGTAGNAARVLWWTKRHGALGASTVPDAIRAGRVTRCVELADGYAKENGYAPRD